MRLEIKKTPCKEKTKNETGVSETAKNKTGLNASHFPLSVIEINTFR